MTTNVVHHTGLRVSDIERAARFYINAFDGHWLLLPFLQEGEFTETVMGGPQGLRFKVCVIGFDEGSLELFEFLEPSYPMEPMHPTRGNLIHYGMCVEDVDAALARAESLGGRRLWPDVFEWGTTRVIYVADPDENVIELLDRPMAQIVEMTRQLFPESDPARLASNGRRPGLDPPNCRARA